MPLRELRAIRPEDQREMGIVRVREPEHLLDEELLRGIGDVVLAADDVADLHLVVINHRGKIIERRLEVLCQRKIPEQGRIGANIPANSIRENNLTLRFVPKTDNRPLPRGYPPLGIRSRHGAVLANVRRAKLSLRIAFPPRHRKSTRLYSTHT